MLDNTSTLPPKLTRREQDCLRLLSAGLLTGEVRAELGISQSTLDAHLASARRKLDSRSTLQAVLRFAEKVKTKSNGLSDATSLWPDWQKDLSEGQISFLDTLARCQTFSQAFEALRCNLSDFGIFTVNFGVIANPVDEMDQSNVAFWCAASEELTSLYNKTELAKSDPVAQHVANSTSPCVFNVEESIPWIKSAIGHIPNVIEYLLDYGNAGALCIPSRDPLTGAAIGINLPLAIKQRGELNRAAAAHRSELQKTLNLFWHALQNKQMIADKPNLAPREKEALQLLARGYAVAEIAERIHVSKRAAEQFLAGARAKLGARNNGQAIYRAMVYRALD